MHLFSPGQLIKDGFMVNLHKDGCMVKDSANRLLAEVHEKGNMYPAYFTIVQPQRPQSIIQTVTEPTARELDERLDNVVMSLTVNTDNDAMCWHQHLSHLNVTDIQSLAGRHTTRMEITESIISSTVWRVYMENNTNYLSKSVILMLPILDLWKPPALMKKNIS